jgi:hypothetical protein
VGSLKVEGDNDDSLVTSFVCKLWGLLAYQVERILGNACVSGRKNTGKCVEGKSTYACLQSGRKNTGKCVERKRKSMMTSRQ